MKIIRTLEEMGEAAPCSLALGAFDGLHRGHMAVIHAACAPGEEGASLEPAVLTFARSPSGNSAVLTGRDKERLLEAAGVERLYSLDFAAVKDWEAEAFVQQVLFAKCGARRLCCGEDFRFGKGARGDVALLRRLCQQAGAELYVAPPVREGEQKVSSTRIRAAVEAGDIPLANRLLGRPFGFSLEVIHGNHIGTGLGTPTINQAIPEGFVLPKFGVYASWCRVGGEYFYGGQAHGGLGPGAGRDLDARFSGGFVRQAGAGVPVGIPSARAEVSFFRRIKSRHPGEWRAGQGRHFPDFPSIFPANHFTRGKVRDKIIKLPAPRIRESPTPTCGPGEF